MSYESSRSFEAFVSAQKRAGGHSGLARICGCSPSNIHQLLERKSLLPGRFVLAVEAATGVSRHDLRPDLYPREEPPAHPPVGCTPPQPAGGSRHNELEEARI
ncbi:transcriptional regulator [Qipengyuania sp.]|uniref:transcriptional regulator n=1 Tax=Qipengyuania sp. TaxID=2004515 RepID=UPI00351923F6